MDGPCVPCADQAGANDAEPGLPYTSSGLNLDDSMSPAEDGYCERHPKRPLQFACLNCSQTICNDCRSLGAHKGHKAIHFEDARSALTQQLAETADGELVRHSYSERLKEKLETALKEYQQAADCTVLNIREEFAGLEQALAAKKVALLAQVQTRIADVTGQYEQALVDLQTAVSSCQESLAAYQSIQPEQVTLESYESFVNAINNHTPVPLMDDRERDASEGLPSLGVSKLAAAIDCITLIDDRPSMPTVGTAGTIAPPKAELGTVSGPQKRSRKKNALVFYEQCRDGHKLKQFSFLKATGSTTCSLCGKVTHSQVNWWYCLKGCAFRLCPECQVKGVQHSADYFCIWNPAHILVARTKSLPRNCAICKAAHYAREMYYCVYCRLYSCLACLTTSATPP